MTDKFDPTTNRIAFGLLTSEEREALKNCLHGIEYYSSCAWSEVLSPLWDHNTVYRGKPAPVVTSKWKNIYPDDFRYTSLEEANEASGVRRIAVLRIDTCNGVSTAHLEEL